eukprot:13153505-Ditylum_brightwellii.AAC.1
MRTLRNKPTKTQHLTVMPLVTTITCRRCIWKGYSKSRMKMTMNHTRKTMMKQMKKKKKKKKKS